MIASLHGRAPHRDSRSPRWPPTTPPSWPGRGLVKKGALHKLAKNDDGTLVRALQGLGQAALRALHGPHDRRRPPHPAVHVPLAPAPLQAPDWADARLRRQRRRLPGAGAAGGAAREAGQERRARREEGRGPRRGGAAQGGQGRRGEEDPGAERGARHAGDLHGRPRRRRARRPHGQEYQGHRHPGQAHGRRRHEEGGRHAATALGAGLRRRRRRRRGGREEGGPRPLGRAAGADRSAGHAALGHRAQGAQGARGQAGGGRVAGRGRRPGRVHPRPRVEAARAQGGGLLGGGPHAAFSSRTSAATIP